MGRTNDLISRMKSPREKEMVSGVGRTARLISQMSGATKPQVKSVSPSVP